MKPAAPFVRSGLQLALHDGGGNGVPFIFQHGLCGSAAQTAEVMPTVEGVRPLTLDCRGHGASEAGDPSGYSIATFTDDVLALLTERHLAPAVIGGISMGAAIATRLAVRHAEAVRALVIARPAWVAASAPDNIRPYGEAGELLSRFPAAEARSRFLQSATAQRLRAEAPDNLSSLVGFFDRTPLDVTWQLLTRIAADGPGIGRAELSRITCPVLVVGHTHDLAHPLAACEELAGLIPHARLVRITPKAIDREAYVSDFKSALATFLKDVVDGTT